MHIPGNSKSTGEHLQFLLQRSFTGDEKLRTRIVLLKNRKSAKARCHAFFWNQSARLNDFPFTVTRSLSICEWKFVHRNAGAIDAQFFWRTAQLDQPIDQRLRTRKHERHCVE